VDEDKRDAIMNVIVPKRSEREDPAYLDFESEGLVEEDHISPSRTRYVDRTRLGYSNPDENKVFRKLNAYGIGSGGTVDWCCSVCTWTMASSHPRYLETPGNVQDAFEHHRCEDHDKLPF
jgi:hypothetical protein